ncbi:winged helix-turn-helix domain-containing protein [Erwinia piriflorinigrans]|uniref:Transcriptional activator cadC n=1 Tax=Erwinia piriflorinigrans CFBP 5888 TaxID=1161919 RepID=V5ZC73_9GAMM|nr:winged helix-turn-helix domain-containing protein [Erwinia piriflorinigrans]CCG88973.1 Transcriptional activator cadC [Erwinia piriflorinigrans CFBP 5888]
MSRKFTINKIITFEPEKKSISGKNASFPVSASAALCLELLIINIGELVTHEQLYDFAWRRFGMEPTSTSLYQNISNLRRALKKSGLNEEIIRTMPRRGFLLSPLTEIVRETYSPDTEPLPDLTAADSDAPAVKEVVLPQTPEVSEQPARRRNETEKTDSKEKNIKKMAVCGIGLMLLLLLALLYMNKTETLEKNSLFVPFMTSDNCSIFVNRDSRLSSEEIHKFISVLNISCQANRYFYITTYKNADRASVFICQNPLLEKENSWCHSDYYIGNMIDE